MADEYIPMEFYTDDTINVDLGEVMSIGDSSVSVNANFNQTDPNTPDYIIGRENIAKHIGHTTFMSYNGGFPDEGELDVTDYITYKPKFNESWDSAFKPMFFTDSSLGSGTGDGLTFHNYYTVWDWHSLSFSIYFHSYTVSGDRKIIRLDYRYANENATAPQSITAYLTTETAGGGGVTEEYVDEAIRTAILDSWEAEV